MNKLSLNQLFQIPAESVENQKGKTFVGIDFGTSTTVVSVANYNAKSKQVECATLHLVQKEADGNIVEAELMPTVIASNLFGILNKFDYSYILIIPNILCKLLVYSYSLSGYRNKGIYIPVIS